MLWDSVKSMWYVEHDGQRRYLARRQITHDQRAAYRIKRSAVATIPESQWTEQDFRSYSPPVKDQDGEGACVGFSSTTVHQTSRAMQGMTFVSLSCGHLYGQINGQQDGGAVVEDALTTLEKVGQCTTATVDDMTWQQRHWPSGAAAEAARFRVEIGGQVTTFEEICSLLELAQISTIGVDIGRNFHPSSAGVLPDLSGSGGGHALPVLGKRLISGRWHLIIRNSWSVTWGDHGDCYMPRSYIDQAGGGHYHVVASRDDPNDPNNPPVAK